ncbi:hypothetical protein [Halioxenophilus aromaticivorans]|uniref:hypothetical protein n=1 Tax=Halioxenophilus aromaticivorans TaxID=1306992 RepID=UPI0031E9D6EC
MRQKLTSTAIWSAPILLAVLTIIGLTSALFSDGGWGDKLAWVCLAIVSLVSFYYWGLKPGQKS